MAMEVTKAAAVAYQGRASDAASQKSKADTKPAVSEAGTEKAVAENTGSGMRLFQPAGSKPENRNDFHDGGQQNNNKQLQQAVAKLKKNLQNQTEAVFGIHEGTNRVMIKIVDKESKDVIKEYPPEETLDMIQKVWEMAGIVFDEKL